VVGKRSYQNTLALFRNVSSRMVLEQIPLIVTDGFGFYEKVVRRLFGSACLYGRVIKTRRNDRIVKVERRAVLGDRWRFGTGAAKLGGLSETQHVVCRTIESHDPTGLSVSWQADDLPSSAETASQRSP
jgi:hypothetical protein